MKRKPSKSRRKSTLVLRPHHPDLQPAIDSLITGESLKGLTYVIKDASLAFDEYEAQDMDDGPN